MKIHITENLDKVISGFKAIPIVYGEVDLTTIPDNSVSHIVAIDAIDSVKSDKIESFIQNIIRKLRLGSILHLGGLDCYAVSRSLVSGDIDISEYNRLIFSKNGSYSATYILNLIEQNHIKIESVVFKGHYYEITATRQIN